MIKLDKFAIAKNVHKMKWNDEPYIIRNVLKNPEDIITEQDKLNIFSESPEFSILTKDREKHRQRHLSTVVNEEVRADKLKKTLEVLNEDVDTVNITEVEDYVPNVKKLCEMLAGIFLCEGEKSINTAHLYVGRKDSKSFLPHLDVPNNFIFQLEGKSEVIVYRQRGSQLLSCQDFQETKIENFHTILNEHLEPVIHEELHPGDMVYIPSRQIHYFNAITDRMSISIPMMGTQGFYGHQPHLVTHNEY